ncbi:MAG: hypothetical protein HY452_01035 [Parcubacteria group bacterium]|nr:hypothetical protein [Parcubacteria group bacterium]
MAKIKQTKQQNQPSNELFAGLGLIALIIGSLYLVFDPGRTTKTEDASAAEYVYDPSGWYLYQTKENNFFHVKYPNDWVRVYGDGAKDEEYLEVKTPSGGIVFKVVAISNGKYINLDSYVNEVDDVNKSSPNFKILKERKLKVAGRPAIQREEYIISEKLYSIVTYVFSKNVIAEFYTDFPEAQKISSYYVTLHNTLLNTFGFTY